MFNLFIFLGPTHKDSLPIGLFALSFSDLCLEYLAIVGSVIKSMSALNLYPNVDLTSLLYILASAPGGMFYDVSAGTFALISLEKCVCVFSPFKAKQLITRKRMTIAIAFVYAFEFSTYGCMFSSTYLSWESYPSTNSTLKLVLMTKGDIQTLLFVNEYLNTLFYFIFTQFLVASCSMLLIFSLNLSKRFRAQTSDVYK